MISSKKLDFFITQEQKQGITGHWALPEQNLGRGFFFSLGIILLGSNSHMENIVIINFKWQENKRK